LLAALAKLGRHARSEAKKVTGYARYKQKNSNPAYLKDIILKSLL
jgi:hypothetical protein